MLEWGMCQAMMLQMTMAHTALIGDEFWTAASEFVSVGTRDVLYKAQHNRDALRVNSGFYLHQYFYCMLS